MSQSAKKIRGDFPPSSRETFFRLESAQDLGIVMDVMIVIIVITVTIVITVMIVIFVIVILVTILMMTKRFVLLTMNL